MINYDTAAQTIAANPDLLRRIKDENPALAELIAEALLDSMELAEIKTAKAKNKVNKRRWENRRLCVTTTQLGQGSTHAAAVFFDGAVFAQGIGSTAREAIGSLRKHYHSQLAARRKFRFINANA